MDLDRASRRMPRRVRKEVCIGPAELESPAGLEIGKKQHTPLTKRVGGLFVLEEQNKGLYPSFQIYIKEMFHYAICMKYNHLMKSNSFL